MSPGHKHRSRPYISNVMRLLELPADPTRSAPSDIINDCRTAIRFIVVHRYEANRTTLKHVTITLITHQTCTCFSTLTWVRCRKENELNKMLAHWWLRRTCPNALNQSALLASPSVISGAQVLLTISSMIDTYKSG